MHAPDLATLHARLGHISLSKLVHVTDVSELIKANKQFTCDTCSLAKFHRLPFSLSTSIGVSPFDLIHVDLWGPYKVADASGAYYFLTLLDDCTWHTWVYLLQNKQQVSTHIQNFISYVRNQFATTIKCFRSDNGTEIFQTLCTSIFEHHGIIHQRSVPRTPQQNGCMERKHRHLVETARAMKIHANLPPKFWGSCILAAIYLINRMPTRLLKWNSHFEALFKLKLDLSHLKVIGCLCYALMLSAHSDKFSPKARQCIFLGYPSGQKPFRLLHKVFISRDVKFEEHVFPFHNHTSSTLPHPVFSPRSTTTDDIYIPIVNHDTPNSPIHHQSSTTSANLPSSQPPTDPPRRTIRTHKTTPMVARLCVFH